MNEKEKNDISAMIELYCKDNHKAKKNKKEASGIKAECHLCKTNAHLCKECESLLEYAKNCLEKCPFKEEKPLCSKCSIHCYSKHFRKQIIKVMRYSGPRILYYKPSVAIRHLTKTIKSKLR